MLYCNLRIRATGVWVNVFFAVEGERFSVPEESHRTDIAIALGLQPDDLEAVDSASDQRIDPLMNLPTPPATTNGQAQMKELLAIPRSGWTVAQKAELLELLAREITK